MGRKPLVNATLLATTALLSTVDPVAVFVDAAVSDGTLEQYNSRISQLLSFLSALPVKMCRGYRYNHKRDSGKRLRGQIDDNMFPSLLEFITLNFPKLQHPTEIAFGVGIRSHALVALLRGSYCPSTRTLTHLSKKANANNGLPFLENSIVTD